MRFDMGIRGKGNDTQVYSLMELSIEALLYFQVILIPFLLKEEAFFAHEFA